MRKQRIRLLSAALLSLLVIAGCGPKQAEPPIPETPPTTSAQPVPPASPPVVSEPQQPDDQETPKTVDPAAKLVAQMSLTEKIGQMVLVGMDGTAVQPDIAALIKDRRIGGIILYSNNIVSPAQTVELANGLRQINRDAGGKLPLLLSTDQEGGGRFPIAEGRNGISSQPSRRNHERYEVCVPCRRSARRSDEGGWLEH